jgi:hypothetical protein
MPNDVLQQLMDGGHVERASMIARSQCLID